VNRILRQVIAAFLLIGFSTYLIPKEVLHAFTHHHDSRHEKHSGTGLRIESEHHHCSLLQFDQTQDYSDFQLTAPLVVTDLSVQNPAPFVHFISAFSKAISNRHSGRAPPSSLI
jgi:ABC-type nickel/cobalt efflux system permease component RcnA